jgi:ribonuclease Y
MLSTQIFITALALLAGGVAGYFIRRTVARKGAENVESKAEKILQEAKKKHKKLVQKADEKHKQKLLEAKEKSIKIIDEAKQEEAERRKELQKIRQRIEKREESHEQRVQELEKKQKHVEKKTQEIETLKSKVREIKTQHEMKLKEVSGLTEEEAKEELFARLEKKHKESLLSRVRKLKKQNEEELERQARKILSLAIDRYAASQSVDTTTTQVELPNDDMKGRIIGKEGRNIKAIEMRTGTEIIVDDTPEVVTISAFSPIRRQVAKKALEMLIKDGRIQPARIEETVQEAKKLLSKEVKKAGEEALYEIGIPVSSLDPKLVTILGRLKYRTSYGQNVLQHSLEVGQISGMLAEELGADVQICKKGGLLHDIGKAVDHDMQGAHPEIGYNIMKKFGLPEEICYQSIAHHEDKPKTIEGVIVKAADAISGARPGARKQSLEQFLQRMEDLERTATSFKGVEKAYAIQAGREVRVFVHPEKVDDLSAHKLAQEIATKIEAELSYPGEVKITLIRETRVTEHAT